MRSNEEVVVSNFLDDNKIPYSYEQFVCGKFPDFLLDNKTIIEVAGVNKDSYFKNLLNKCVIYEKAGFKVFVYNFTKIPFSKKYELRDFPSFLNVIKDT